MWGHPSNFIQWKRVLEAIGYKVICITLYRHEDDQRPDGFSVMDYVEQVRRIVQKIGPCILLGHSMGGLIVQKVGVLEPNVKKVVIVTSAAPKGVFSLAWRVAWTMIKPPWKYLSRMKTGKSFRLTSKELRWLMMNECSPFLMPESVFRARESGLAARELASGQIPVEPLKCPSLVIGGRKDRMTPFRIQRAIAKIHGSTLMKLNCAHLPMLEGGWHEVINRIIEWIETD